MPYKAWKYPGPGYFQALEISRGWDSSPTWKFPGPGNNKGGSPGNFQEGKYLSFLCPPDLI